MDGLTLLTLLAALLLGLVAGLLVARRLAGARGETEAAQAAALAAAGRAAVADAQAAAAHARTEAAGARTEAAAALGELSSARADVQEAKARAAESHAEASAAQAEAAEWSAKVAKAEAERDAAVARAAEIGRDREAMLAQFKVLSTETLERQGRSADASAQVRLEKTEQLMLPVRQQLDTLNARLVEVEKERVAMSVDLRASVRSVQETGETLRRETSALVTALRKPQIRGSWGETQLKRVAEIAGMLERCDFDLQQTMAADDRTMRPDMRVNLAEGKHVFVDSKVPLSAFLEAAEAADEQVRSEALTRYGKHVRGHVDQLSGKQYWKGAETPEFVVLFLPSEAFFATALDQVPDLYDYAAARDVVLATPTTMIGLLRAVAYGWRQAALAESAAEVFKLGRELHEKLGLMGSRFDKLGRALRSSVTAYNDTVATVEGTVLVRARKFRDLKVSERELVAPQPVDDAVRQIQAAELVEDAVQVEPMVGRPSRRRRAVAAREVPEAAELVRGEPDLLELVEGELAGAEPEPEARTS